MYDCNHHLQLAPCLGYFTKQGAYLVPTFLLAQVAYLPNKVIGSLTTEPQLQYASDAETFILTSEEAPCALQPKPELHKAILVVFDFDHFDLDHFDHYDTFL